MYLLTMMAATTVLMNGSGLDRPLPFARPFLLKHHHFIVCAHRGDHTASPENSLEAIEAAIKDDVDFVELDLRTTKDGQIVLMHDDTIDRMTNGVGKVRDLTFDWIRDLRLKGSQKDSLGNEAGKVPTFEEALEVAKGRVQIYMDIKDVTPAQVLPLLRKHGMERRVIAYVYDARQRDAWHAEAPRIPLISDLGGMKDVAQIESDWTASRFAITDGSALHYKPEFVDQWHKLGVAVVPDIQNPGESPRQWKPFIDMGVDGFQTDHPGQLVAYLTELGIR